MLEVPSGKLRYNVRVVYPNNDIIITFGQTCSRDVINWGHSEGHIDVLPDWKRTKPTVKESLLDQVYVFDICFNMILTRNRATVRRES